MALIGFMRNYDSLRKETTYLSYAEYALDSRKRSMLKNELSSNPNLHLYCCCSAENDHPVYLNEDAEFQFPSGIPHSKGCVEYIRSIGTAVSRTSVGPLLRNGGKVPVSFSWKPRGRRTVSMITSSKELAIPKIGPLDFATLIAYSNMITFSRMAAIPQKDPRDDMNAFCDQFLYQFMFHIETKVLADPKGNELPLRQYNHLKRSSPAGGTYFLYGTVTEINEKYKQAVYLRIHTVYGNQSVAVPKELWSDISVLLKNDDAASLPLWFGALVDVRMKKKFVKGSYDSVTKTSYGGGSGEEYRACTVRQGVLFHANHYGLICTTNEECEVGEQALQNGCGVEKPCISFPVLVSGGVSRIRPYLVMRDLQENTFLYPSASNEGE